MTADLVGLLTDCKEKLLLYYKDTNGEYPGGEPLQTLNPRIDKAIAELRALAGAEVGGPVSTGFAVVSEEMDGLAIASDDNGQMLIFCNKPLAMPHMRNGSENVCRVQITRETPPPGSGRGGVVSSNT